MKFEIAFCHFVLVCGKVVVNDAKQCECCIYLFIYRTRNIQYNNNLV
jgi:hypothetical protein